MKKFEGAIAVMFAFTSFLSACSGCSPIWPGIVSAAQSVKVSYYLADDEIAKEYKKEILPFLERIRALERMVTVEQKVIVGIEIENLVTERGILEKLSRLRAAEMLRSQNINTQKGAHGEKL